MKKSFLNLLKRAFLLMGVVSLVTLYSCDDESDDPIEDPIASFQFAVSESNYLEVTFTNYSQNATSYSWNFGDQQTSTETDPVHVYDAAGTYDVVLTATNTANVSKTFTQTITITDPNVALRLLAGDVSKEWRLIRSEPCMGVSETPATIFNWWSLSNDGSRPCVYEQTWTFNFDGTMTFDDAGTFWGEEFVFDGTDVKNMCFTPDASNMVNKDGVDLTSLLSGTHQFDYNSTTGKLTLTGEGVWIGLPKVSATGDVRVPQQSITYDIDITEEDGYDLMTLSMTGDGWFWAFKYASYVNPADEPEIVSFRVDFDYTVEDFVVTFVNNSQDATSYSWDFGDGNTSTEANPVHTYAAEGAYEVILTGTSGNESKTATKTISISLNPTELAPAPTEPEANVISIYSDAYTDIAGVNIDPDWGQATVTQEVDILSEKVLKMTGLNYQGIDWAATPLDVSGKTKLHVDIYCTSVTDINLSVIGAGENPVTLTTEAGVWKSFDIALSEYTVPDLTQVIQVKFDDAATGAAPTIFVDNIYFY